MKLWLTLMLLLALALPAAAGNGEVQLAVHETATLAYPGAITAFAVDSDIVEVTSLGGQVMLAGRRAGTTLVTVVLPSTVETLNVRVEAAAARVMELGSAASRPLGSWEGRYDSGNRRFSTGLAMESSSGTLTARLQLYGIYQNPEWEEGQTMALPTASLEIATPKRSLVLLDEFVRASPLTLNGTVLRGFHLYQGPLTLHAGVASATPWNDLLLPSKGDRALGMSYGFDLGALRFTPALLWLPDSETGVPGVVSLGLERGKEDAPWRLKAELAWSEVPGGSLDLSWHGERRQGWLQASTRSADFAALSVARSAGSYLDGVWSERVGERSRADLTLSASSLDLPDHRPEVGSGRLELRNQITDHLSLTTGVGGSAYRDLEVENSTLRRGTATLGGAYDAAGLGIAALYRYQQTSGTEQGGHGGRLTLRGTGSAWKANLYVDVQQQVPTLDMIFGERPDLARAFATLGFIASTPEELVRLMRDNAPLLAQQGVEVGSIDLAPLRLQGGVELSWRGSGRRHPEVGLRLMADDTQSATTGRRTYLGTLFSSCRIFGDTELYAGYTRWSIRHAGSASDDAGSYEIALRTSFSAPSLPGGGAPISGEVFRDDSGGASSEKGLLPLADVEVVLDGQRRTRTDRDGRFYFSAPGRGKHRVQALLPQKPGAYFTMPSEVILSDGDDARFAIAFSAAHLKGTVRSDAGLPLAGVTVKLKVDGAREFTEKTDSGGAYRFAVAAGEGRVSLVPDSVPPGYDLSDLGEQVRGLAAGAPALADFTIRAQRTLQGEVGGAAGKPLTVTALEAGRTVTPDGKGRFILRGLPAGPVTLVVRGMGRETRQVIQIAAEPGLKAGVRLAAP